MVSERGSGHISNYTPSGKKIQTINLRNPLGLTLDGEGNIIVGEDTNHSIIKYSPEGQLLVSVGIMVQVDHYSSHTPETLQSTLGTIKYTSQTTSIIEYKF